MSHNSHYRVSHLNLLLVQMFICMLAKACVCVCVWVSEFSCVCVCVCASEWVALCVCVRVSELLCVCVCEWVSCSVCVSVCEWVSLAVYVCVCACEWVALCVCVRVSELLCVSVCVFVCVSSQRIPSIPASPSLLACLALGLQVCCSAGTCDVSSGDHIQIRKPAEQVLSSWAIFSAPVWF